MSKKKQANAVAERRKVPRKDSFLAGMKRMPEFLRKQAE